MQTPRSTRSSVLGKRPHRQRDVSLTPSMAACDQQLQTPDPTPNPKRARTSSVAIEGDSNKENVPPFISDPINVGTSPPPSARSARALRRTTTELPISPRARPSTRRHASTSAIIPPATPTAEISCLAVATPPPTPPTSILPVYARARALLRSTCNSANTDLAGREIERATIHEFLVSFLDSSATEMDDIQPTSLFISGSPGTGKTALVNSILRSLPPNAKVISINCMALNSIDSLWERLAEELDDGKKQKVGRTRRVKGRDAVESLLSAYHTKCIVILDELDHITPTTQSLASLFSLPTAAASALRVIGIANTHTLTSSSSRISVSASAHVRTLHFAPYTSPQLLQILQSRLTTLYEHDAEETTGLDAATKLLPSPALMLLTKKVAALTGDVRSLFEVLRGAIDLAVVSSSLPAADENPLNTPAPSVTPTHILAALKAYTPSSTSKASTSTASTAAHRTTTSNSETVTKILNLGLQARLVLLCILLASKRLDAGLPISPSACTSPTKKSPISPIKRTSSLPNPTTQSIGISVDVNQLHAYYGAVLTRSDRGVFDPVSRGEFGDLVNVLEGVGLVCAGGASAAGSITTPTKRTFGRSASFGGAGFGGAKGKGKGTVRLAEGVRTDEVLRGLGVVLGEGKGGAEESTDVGQEEVKVVWEREKSRLGRDLKGVERERGKALSGVHRFEGAEED